MDQLKVDLGIEEFDLGCGVLRFNPADPNLYARFLDLEPQLESLQQALSQETARATDAAGLIKALAETDRQLKDLLTQVFGEENDFSKLLRGINLLSTAGNGLSVAENLLAALEPVLSQGAERFVESKMVAAREKARQRRENL